MRKAKIPKHLREQVWVTHFGERFKTKCKTKWCTNIITVFDFQCGHDIPESRGGRTSLENLVPICGRCNLSMGNTHTFNQWKEYSVPISRWRRFLRWLFGTKENGTRSSQNRMNRSIKPSESRGSSSKMG